MYVLFEITAEIQDKQDPPSTFQRGLLKMLGPPIQVTAFRALNMYIILIIDIYSPLHSSFANNIIICTKKS